MSMIATAKGLGTGWARRRWRDRSAPPPGRHRGPSSDVGTRHRPDLAELVGPLLVVRRAVGAVFGLTPAKYQSGEIDRTGGISRCGDEMMRVMLYEAAQILLVRSTKWSWLKAWAMQIARRRGVKKAIVALARRLAVIMHRIWVDGTEFRWTREVVAA